VFVAVGASPGEGSRRSLTTPQLVSPSLNLQDREPPITVPPASANAPQTPPEPSTLPRRVDYESLGDIIPDLPKRRLTMGDAIREVLANNLDIELKTLAVGSGKARLREARGIFEPAFNFDGRWEDLRTPQNTQQFVATGGNALLLQELNGDPRIFDEDNYRWKTSIAGKLPTGTQYELFNQWDILSNTLNRDPAIALFSPEYTSFTGVTITQPLLRDFGFDANLAEIRVARKNIFISGMELRAAILTAVTEVMTNYYDLVYATENVKLRQEDVDLALRLTKNRRDQLERGLATTHDLERGQSAVAEAIEKLVQAENERVSRQTILTRLLVKEVGMEDKAQFLPDAKFRSDKLEVDRNQLVATAFKYRADYLAAKEKVEREQIKIRYAKNQIWPRVDVKSTIGYIGLGASGGQAISRNVEGEGTQYSVGVAISIPFGNKTALGRRDEAIKQEEESVTNLKIVEVNTVLEIKKSLAAMDTNYKRYQAMRLFRQVADDGYDQEKTRLERGLTNELELMKFHREQTEAKTREIAALADYNKSIVALLSAEGTLLEYEHIVIDK
jgi:outer membrane protein